MTIVHSLRLRLSLLFVAFLALVTASVTVTFVTLERQRHDALLINLAGRQRMLSQRMTWLALAAPESAALQADRARFQQTLTALRFGGPALDPTGRPVTLPAPTDPALERVMDEAATAWERFQIALNRLTAAPRRDAPAAEDVAALTAASSALLDSLDRSVAVLTALAEAKVQRLRLIQAGFWGMALGLLVVGYYLTRSHLLRPLARLERSAQQMAAGNLETPVPTVFVLHELRQLGATLETMRRQVLAGRHELEERVRHRTRELTTAFEFTQEIVGQLELEQLLDSVTQRSRALLAGSAAALCLLDEEARVLRLAAGSGEGQADRSLRQPVDGPLAGQVIGQGRVVVTETACASCGFLRSIKPGSHCIATPLRAGNATLGALCVVRPQVAQFEPEEEAALSLLANTAAVAILNARLVEEGRRQAELAAARAERERLARNLHDNLAQTLSFLNLRADRLEELIAAGAVEEAAAVLGEMRMATARAYDQVRDALTGLRAAPLNGQALLDSLRGCVAEMRSLTGLAIELICEGVGDGLPLSPVAQQQALHIVREALTNAWRHAHARSVRVTVRRTPTMVTFTVADDGCGFDPAAVDETTHLGLTIMQARAERSGGRLVVDTAPGAGTRVIATFPVESTSR